VLVIYLAPLPRGFLFWPWNEAVMYIDALLEVQLRGQNAEARDPSRVSQDEVLTTRRNAM
jgi:hypothetical protein